MSSPIPKATKYIIMTGGVMSGLGKGISISSIGVLLQLAGYSVTSIKIDPYLNCDAGTMSPYEHGEVFVLDDGGEADLDLGNYERFLGIHLRHNNNITTGKVYMKVIEAERRGDYLGKTVQIVPHITECIKEWIKQVGSLPVDGTSTTPDICLIEVGGTVGDIESSVYLEGIRQLIRQSKRSDVCLGFVSLVPVIGVVGEQKTKPTQHAIQELRKTGLFADFLICRTETALTPDVKRKLSLFSDMPESHVISCHDCRDVLEVPSLLYNQNILGIILNKLELPLKKVPDLTSWNDAVNIITNELTPIIKIAIVGKYTGFEDSYLSVKKSLIYACLAINSKVDVVWIDSSSLIHNNDNTLYEQEWKRLKSCHGILIPGGFGSRGVEGMITAINYARTKKIPFLGICLGMQLAVVEYYRNMLNRPEGHSSEFDESCDPVIKFMPEISQTHLGGTMRLGGKNTVLFDFNNGDIPVIKQLYGNRPTGLEFVGKDETTQTRMEIIELPQSKHPYFVGVQFHPEFTSKFTKPSPPFLGLVLAASNQLDTYLSTHSQNYKSPTQPPMPPPPPKDQPPIGPLDLPPI